MVAPMACLVATSFRGASCMPARNKLLEGRQRLRSRRGNETEDNGGARNGTQQGQQGRSGSFRPITSSMRALMNANSRDTKPSRTTAAYNSAGCIASRATAERQRNPPPVCVAIQLSCPIVTENFHSSCLLSCVHHDIFQWSVGRSFYSSIHAYNHFSLLLFHIRSLKTRIMMFLLGSLQKFLPSNYVALQPCSTCHVLATCKKYRLSSEGMC
jgi:hypothetical protein